MSNSLLKNWLKRFKLNESTISMILGALVIIVIGALIVNYFRGVGRPEEEIPVPPEEIKLVEEEGKLYPEGLPTTHKVAAGEYLWAVAEKYYGSGYNWVDIAKENKLSNPNRLLVDQELTIPKAAVIKPAIASDSIFGPAITGDKYTVVKNDHLWGIAVRAYGDGYRWGEIAKANNIVNPSLIHPGNTLTLPR